MGEEADFAGQSRAVLPGWLADKPGPLPEYLIREYRLSEMPDMLELLERLDGLVMRDQRAMTADDVSAQRKSVHAAAERITKHAAAARAHLHALKEARDDFEHAVGSDFWSAIALEETFDIPFIAPTALEPPEVFDPVRLAFRETHWRKTHLALEALATLPVRPRLRTNKVRNHVLEQALRLLRDFWIAHGANHKWGRSMLADRKIKFVKKDEKVNPLSGQCERFVADTLLGSGIHFDWATLNSAWVSLDKRLRETGESD